MTTVDMQRLVPTPATEDVPSLLDIEDVMAIFAISRREAWRYVERGWLPAVKMGRKVTRFRPQDVAQLIDSKLVLTGGTPPR